MHKRQQLRRTSTRDEDLRAAHQRAFEQIRAARASAHEKRAVKEAIEALIDACEAYTLAAHNSATSAA